MKKFISSIFLLIAIPCFIITETTNAQNNETKYSLKIIQTPHGTVTSSRNDTTYGNLIVVTGEPDEGYYLDYWTEIIEEKDTFIYQGNLNKNDGGTIAIAIFGNTTIYANFKPKIAQKYIDKSGNIFILYKNKKYNILGTEIK